MDQHSDNELLEKFRNPGTRHAAFDLLVKQYQQKLYWHVRRMILDHEDSNDVIQNVFLKVWHSLEGFRNECKLYTWLYRIATNECLSFLKQKKRRFMVSFTDVEGEMADRLSNDPLFTGDRIQLRLQRAILRLPEQQRIVFNMKYFDGMKYEEISEVLGLTVGGLKATYHHAVKKISRYVISG
jgi:RNA polymerase sigma factor (sigma-70 family)